MKTIYIFSIILFIVLYTQVNGQVKYVDIEPDIRLEGVHHLNLDLDSNGSIDFRLIHDTVLANWPNEGAQINVIHHMGMNEIVGQESGHFYPKPLAFNTLLFDGSKSWGIFEDNLALYVWVITGGVLSHHGLWRYLSDDRFVGFRMQSDQGQLYGWIRLFVSPDGKYMVFRDYAYMELPDIPMLTGQGIPIKTVEKLEVSDEFDFGDGRDLQISFSPPQDEIALSHYRVLVIKSSAIGSIDLLAATNVPVGNVTKVYPGTNHYSFFLNENTKDVDGECIKTGEEYVVKVLSLGRLLDNPENALSAPSAPFSLNKLSAIKENAKEDISVSTSNNQCIISSDSKIITIQLYNLNGQLYKTVNSNSNYVTINLGEFDRGALILRIETEQKIINRKIYITF
ncbi:MAG: T9SS type A sorting domain-containing protein [Bacteroidetes bacterium]|nr:T9SS type A sorting domain-containing protein [Bacteroidota bacterium]MBT3802145.1 T9SS type A sorting domain-containing protein [Bacteroidota bacterium]MBT4969144.1 T9SS type A sorting domain-containing protein [Bacteroidota bacterium]